MSAPESLSPDQFHSFDVEVSSHDLLKHGVTRARLAGEQIYHHRVNISAEYSHAEAEIIAAQMRAATSGAMPTRTYSRI